MSRFALVAHAIADHIVVWFRFEVGWPPCREQPCRSPASRSTTMSQEGSGESSIIPSASSATQSVTRNLDALDQCRQFFVACSPFDFGLGGQLNTMP